jgi:hypothetical protein
MRTIAGSSWEARVAETPDFDLIRTSDESSSEELGRRPTGPWPLILLLVLIAAIAVGGYLIIRSRSAAPAGPVAAPGAAAVESSAPLGGSALPGDVPPLDASDLFVRDLVKGLSTHPRVAAWLATDGLIRNFTTVVSNIADGATPAGRIGVLKPSGSFQVAERGGHLYVDARSYERYNDLAAAFSSLDVAGAARVYATLKPRIEEAHGELGAPAGSCDGTLERAIVLLLQTPVRDQPLQVEPSGIGYRFADDRLESLNGAQKHLLRMGPANARLVQRTLRDLALALGIPASRLPGSGGP